MTDDNENFDRERVQKLRDTMSAEEIEALRARFDRDPHSLSVDEAGVLFLVTREKIRAFEAKARRKKDRAPDTSDPESAE
jgi:DNA-directed RNA polymerase sigma subunit (sigma70/sigma32)